MKLLLAIEVPDSADYAETLRHLGSAEVRGNGVTVTMPSSTSSTGLYHIDVDLVGIEVVAPKPTLKSVAVGEGVGTP